MNLMLKLFIKSFKTIIIKKFQHAIKNSLQTNEKKKKKTQQRNICQKCQIEIIKLKSTRKTKLLDQVNRRVEMTKGRGKKFDDSPIEFT